MFSPGIPISDRPPLVSLLRIMLTIALGFIIVGPLVGMAIASNFYDGNLYTDLPALTSPGLVSAIMVIQTCTTLIGLILIPVIYITRLEHKPLAPLFPSQSTLPMMLLLVAGLGLSFPMSVSPLTEWNMKMDLPDFMNGFEEWARTEEDKMAKLTSLMTNIDTVGEWVIGIFVIALLPAIGEELVFRGMIQQELTRATKNVHIAIWAAAFIFSAIHMQFFGFIPRLLLGALFGYLYYWSGNLLIPIFSHFFNNAFGVTMLYLNKTGVTSIDVEDPEALPFAFVIPAMLVTGALLYIIRKHYRELPPATLSTPVDHHSQDPLN